MNELRDADPMRRFPIELDNAEDALLEEILQQPRQRPRYRRRVVGGLLAAAAVLGAIGIQANLGQGSEPPLVQITPDGPNAIYSAAMIRAAERNPRLLLEDPEWRIVTVSGFLTDIGEVTYRNGDRYLKVFWSPASIEAGYVANRDREYQHYTTATADGPVTVYVMGPHSFDAHIPAQGPAFAEVRADLDRAEFDRLLAGLKRVDVRTWLDALPRSVVTPDRTRSAVQRVLEGVPVPAGFDPVKLEDIGTNSLYDVTVKVIDAVACGWMREWAAGDEAARAKAVEALVSSRQWPILLRMKARGDETEYIWWLADQVAAGKNPPSWRASLQCYGTGTPATP